MVKEALMFRAVGLLAALALTLCGCANLQGHGPSQARIWVTTGDQSQLMAEQAPLVSSRSEDVMGLPVVTVNAAERHQSMVGFGASITDASAWLIQTRLTQAQRDGLMTELFGRGEGGLGFSFIRLTIGASDFSLDHYSLDDAPDGAADPELKYFSVVRPAQYVFPTVRQALAINPDLQVMATPWSAPAWMKTTNSLVKGQLKSEAYPAYANFFARYIKAAGKAGVPTDYLSIQNEPDFEPENYPGMRWPAADRARFYGDHLGPVFKREAIRTRVLDWDHNWDQPQQPLTVLADPKAAGRCFWGRLALLCWRCAGSGSGGGSASGQGRVLHGVLGWPMGPWVRRQLQLDDEQVGHRCHSGQGAWRPDVEPGAERDLRSPRRRLQRLSWCRNHRQPYGRCREKSGILCLRPRQPVCETRRGPHRVSCPTRRSGDGGFPESQRPARSDRAQRRAKFFRIRHC